ncbi:MAG: hypothetical protein IJI41_08280 [Anaerolineaceae bacterium]|nr:hypothetical protein [Anaerolineaceae bacterium]
MKRILEWVLPFLLIVAFIYGRIVCYGPMNDSVSVQDTSSYIAAAEMSPLSLSFFEQQRSPTYPLLIKLSNPTLEIELTQLSEPYFGTESRLAVQPGTETLVRNQTVISIICWVACAILAASSLNGIFAKTLVVFLILGCGFVPQIADWDSILSSESISFSLFVLSIGLLLKVIPDGRGDRWSSWVAGAGLVITNFFWIFTRDTNAYFIIVEAVLLIIISAVYWIRRKGQHISTILCGFSLVGLFFFHQGTFRVSERWLLPTLNNIIANVFPYPERVEFFKQTEMPTEGGVLELTGSAEYNNIYQNEKFIHWARRFGMSTYQNFLLSMPLWTVQQVYENLDSFFEENRQPFFYGSNEQRPHWAEKPGNLLLPLSASVILIDLLLLILLAVKAVQTGDASHIRFFWGLLILFLGGGLLMSISYLGEVRSIWRHVLGGVTALRLTLWIVIAALFSLPEQTRDSLPYNNDQTERD